ncbi:MAG: hypothetical protein QG649_330, partial [Patescibacteria group bacterium]|nr:hypothetical protein [Patescibacteria group bacterium]
DKKTDFGGYSPQNADRRFRGNVTVRQALDWSLNVPAVKVMQQEGLENAISAAEKLGISTLDEAKNYGLSLALGSAEVPLTEMTSAYSAYANQGERYEETSIKTIKNKYDQTIFIERKQSSRGISTEGAYLLSNILSDNQTRSAVFGSSLTVTGTDGRVKNVAVKTGTTDDSRDAWTIGYTPEIAVGVWVGNNDNEMMANGGAGMAGPIWRNMMRQAIGSSNPTFAQPSGVVKATVCTSMGTKTDVFLSSNVPKQCNETKKEQPKEETPKEVEKEKCKIIGKENLDADNEACVVDSCKVKGLENLAANDPKCVEPPKDADADGDGVADTKDKCAGTPAGTNVDSQGCPVITNPQGGTVNGAGINGNRINGG